MIHYPHFAMSNLYLRNGYIEFSDLDNLAYEYEDEIGLEQCIRKILLRKQARLSGWDVRFLRRGINLSQQDFGDRIGRDSQTIARWEKRSGLIDDSADLLVRFVAASVLEPTLQVQELVNPLGRRITNIPSLGRIVLWRQSGCWLFAENPTFGVLELTQNDVFEKLTDQVSTLIARPTFRVTATSPRSRDLAFKYEDTYTIHFTRSPELESTVGVDEGAQSPMSVFENLPALSRPILDVAGALTKAKNHVN